MTLDVELPKLVSLSKPATGTNVIIYKNSSNPTLAAYGSLQAGSAFEPEGRSGIAELTSRLLLRGSRKLSAVKLADELESVGAAISFRNTQDNIVFQIRTTSKWTRKVLSIFSECLNKPAFKQSDLEKERDQVLSEIRLRDDDTTRRGLRELHRLVYPPKHPYRRDRLGTAESIKSIERSDLVEYFERTANKAHATIAFAGDLNSDEISKWVEDTFEPHTSTNDSHSETSPIPSQTEPESREIVMAHKTQSDILFGSQAIRRADADFEPLNLLISILGELGFMGRLGQRVRDKEGLAYSCTSFLNAGSFGGNWTALAGVNPRNVARAMELMREEIGRVCAEEVTAEELDSAKQNQIGSALMELESTEGVARTTHNLVYFGLGLEYYARRRQMYKKITTGELLAVARKYLESSLISTVIVGPKARAAASKS